MLRICSNTVAAQLMSRYANSRQDAEAASYAKQLAPEHYFDRCFNREAVKVPPGGYYVTNQDIVLVTVLGSCVSACIRDCQSGLGGMNHFMLPNNPAADSSSIGISPRYGVHAMEILIDQLLLMGALRGNLEAKVFGGGEVLQGFNVCNVSQRNANFVLKYLAENGVKLIAQDLADIYPRKIYYFPNSGKVSLRKLSLDSAHQVVDSKVKLLASRTLRL